TGRKMNIGNCSLNEFIFVGVTNNAEMKGTLFAIFLLIYLINILGNLDMIILIRVNPQLHTLMYFFLSHLSFCDLCYSTAIGPKMLVDIFGKNKSIPFWGTNMSSRLCSMLMAAVYLVGTSDALIHTTLAFRLCFCGSNETNHFFCDLPPLYLLSCSDTQINELALFTIYGFLELSTISGVLVSYCYIISSVLKIHSTEGRFKAFSTCTSHFTAVAIFQETLLFTYFRPSSSYSLDQDKMTSLFYTLVIPMLNPLIYSLRNKDVKESLKKIKINKWF
ncbi:hypothetical protein U0070_024387, partial [Myodes glareolus]